MIYQRAALREFANTSSAVFVALLAILLTTQLIRLLAEAAGGRLASEAVLALLGFGALNYLPVLLSLTVFIAILLSLSRSYRDSEMVVWFASGLPLTAWIRPVLTFALPAVLVITLLSTVLTPWALTKSSEFRQQMRNRDDVAQVMPGVFRESSQAERVFFVEAVAGDDKRVKNVFVSSMQHGRLGVMAAAQGRQEVAANGDRFLVLENGRRYEGVAGQADYRMMQFERYAIRIEAREAQTVIETPRQLTTLALLKNLTPKNRGELVWRIGMPLSALILALLAIPLSFVNPRAGRMTNLVFAILTYMVYNNLLSVSQAWVAQERIAFSAGLLTVHGVMLALLVLLMAKRMWLFSWGQRLWR